MMRVSNSNLFNNGTDLMKMHQEAIAKLQQQISTGLRVLQPSDDPVAARQIVSLQNTIIMNEQFKQNIDAAYADLQYEDSILNQVNDVIQRAKELAIQASNSTLSSTNRSLIATEIDTIRDQLIDFANAKNTKNGYLFSGFAVNTKPVQNISGTYTYMGDEGVRTLGISQNASVPLNHTGKSVFFDVESAKINATATLGSTNAGSAAVASVAAVSSSATAGEAYTIVFNSSTSYSIYSNDDLNTPLTGYNGVTYTSGENINFEGVRINITGTPVADDEIAVSLSQPTYQDIFTSLSNLSSAIRNYGSDPARLNYEAGVSIANLNNTEIRVLEKRTEVGARMNLLDNQRNLHAATSLDLQETKSKIQDVDMSKAISDLSQRTLLLETTQATLARVLNLSLFNFLR